MMFARSYLIAFLLCAAPFVRAGEKKEVAAKLTPASVVKVLTHLVDSQGRHTEAPSLYERDAYQAFLREHPELVSTVRFDIQWKARAHRPDGYVLRVEMRGSKMELSKMAVFEKKVHEPKFLSKWSRIELTPEQFKKFGEPLAWRVSVWDGATMVDSQESFLW
jgi:hypothetical protein